MLLKKSLQWDYTTTEEWAYILYMINVIWLFWTTYQIHAENIDFVSIFKILKNS